MSAAVPITISGSLVGRSQCRTTISCGSGRLMQPRVGRPVLAWRKIPEPRPGTTGLELYAITARCRYAVGERDMSSIVRGKGGVEPHGTWRKRLYQGERKSSTH